MLLSWVGIFAASVSALILTLLLAPIFMWLAHRHDLLDHPDGGRKRQKTPIPVVGGTVLYLTFLAVTAAGLFLLAPNKAQWSLWASIVIPASIVFIIGIYDDLYTSSPTRRLVFQSLAATLSSILTLTSETHIKLFDIALLDQFIGVVWIVTLTNAFNFIDNMDGHSLTIAAIAASGFAFIAASNGQWLIAASSAVIAASSLALLRWNWHPAKLYLGDGGALFIGFLLATLALRIELQAQPKLLSAAIPIIILLVPILDIVIAVLGRLQRGVSPLTAGRDHLSHRARSTGLKVESAVLLWACVASVGAMSAVYFSKAELRTGALVLAAIATGFFISVYLILTRTKPLT